MQLKARLHERKKWNGSDKKWNGSDKFLRVNDTWPAPLLPVLFKKRVHRRLWSFFGMEQIKIGSEPTIFFPFERENALLLFGTDKRRFFLSLWSFYVSCLL